MRREATPVEISALLMDAVCKPSPREQDAVKQLAALMQMDAGRMQSELMFLRSFAADLATSVTLGAGRERDAILDRYYSHWQQVDSEIEGVMEDLQAHLELYSASLAADNSPAGLQEQLGQAFASCCEAGAEAQDLVALGGAMFGAFYREVADLLQEVDIILSDESIEEDA